MRYRAGKAPSVVNLSDSDQVILNKFSRLDCRGGGIITGFRGEAYFKLKTQRRAGPLRLVFKNIVVDCDSAAEFNVNAFRLHQPPDTGKIGLYLAHSIRFTAVRGKLTVMVDGRTLTVSPGETYLYGDNGGRYFGSASLSADSTWIKGRRDYIGISFEEFSSLTRWFYGIAIDNPDGLRNFYQPFSFSTDQPFSELKADIERYGYWTLTKIRNGRYVAKRTE